jgi:hypothetical protein
MTVAGKPTTAREIVQRLYYRVADIKLETAGIDIDESYDDRERQSAH